MKDAIRSALRSVDTGMSAKQEEAAVEAVERGFVRVFIEAAERLAYGKPLARDEARLWGVIRTAEELAAELESAGGASGGRDG